MIFAYWRLVFVHNCYNNYLLFQVALADDNTKQMSANVL